MSRVGQEVGEAEMVGRRWVRLSRAGQEVGGALVGQGRRWVGH